MVAWPTLVQRDAVLSKHVAGSPTAGDAPAVHGGSRSAGVPSRFDAAASVSRPSSDGLSRANGSSTADGSPTANGSPRAEGSSTTNQAVADARGHWRTATLSPLLVRLLASRGVAPDELDFSLKGLPDPAELVPVAAIDLLLAARQRRVLVVADYDADGATACAVMVKGLRLLGFSCVDYLVPDRFADGYGLTPPLVERARAGGAELIITVDNGIASLAGVAAANAAGIAVLVTDHHLPGEQLPPAAAIVNPRLVPTFAATELAGVGVAFYVLLALRRALRERGDAAGHAALVELLDLVALGTVADVVKLDRCNRILVEQGLRRMRAGVCCEGIKALAVVARREQGRLCSADMGFALGPRLNAAGRLADMTHGIECLLAPDAMRAQQLAEELDAINRDRRQIESGMQREAERQLATLNLDDGNLPAVFSLYSSAWHEGVVGLLASRVKERTQRPVFAFADSQQPGMLKGSGRSIQGVHLRDALAEVNAMAPGLVPKFGGHAMAAGLSLAAVDLPRFRELLARVVARKLTPELLERRLLVDGRLAAQELTLDNAEILTMTPWGQGFPAPLFYGEFELIQQRLVAEKHLKLTLGLPTTSGIIDGIHFNADLDTWPAPECRRVEGVYRLETNSFRGRVSPQLLFEYLRPWQAT